MKLITTDRLLCAFNSIQGYDLGENSKYSYFELLQGAVNSAVPHCT